MTPDDYFGEPSLERIPRLRRESDERLAYPKIVYSELPDPKQQPERFNLIESWRLIKRHPGTLILCACIGLICAILYTVPQTPLFQARTALEIQNMNGDFLNAKQVSPVSDDSAMNVLTDVQTQIKILQSQHLMRRVIARLKDQGKLGPLQSPPVKFIALRQMLKLATPKPLSDRQMEQSLWGIYPFRNWATLAWSPLCTRLRTRSSRRTS